MKIVILTLLCSLVVATAEDIVTRGGFNPRKMQRVIYYDNSFCFVVGEVIPPQVNSGGSHQTVNHGMFVHSKMHDQWVQVLKISTTNGIFGKSDIPIEHIWTPSVFWDFTPLAQEQFAEIPLQISALFCFPDEIVYDADTETFQLGFLTIWNVPEAATYLYIKRKDLLESFNKKNNSNEAVDSTASRVILPAGGASPPKTQEARRGNP